MALNINGTTGISGVDGSASAPALQGTDSNTGINFGSDTVNINTGGATRATVDSSGRLLLGTTTGGSSTADDLTISNSGNMGITLRSTDSNYCNIFFSDGTSGDDEYRGAVQYYHPTNFMRFLTDATERIRIDSGGNVGIGTPYPNNADSGDGGLQINPNISNGAPQVAFKRASTGNTSNAMVFVNGNVGVGSISYTNGGTSYNTSSDYRLKENVTAISDGITRLKTLKPSRFNFKVDTDTTVDGFLAHEVSSIVPEAISGTKDAVDSADKPIYQGIDQSKLVPLLTAALQEAIAKIEVLETKVAALEAG